MCLELATRSSSSLFIVLLLTSALFVSLSATTVPTEVRALPGTVILSPNHASPGNVITVTGGTWGGHLAGEGCAITANNPFLIVSAFCIVGAGNLIFGTFTVGNVPGGAIYTVFVTAGVDTSAGTAFTVDAGISLSPIQGPPGIHVTVTGGGFSSTGTCALSTFPLNIIQAGSDVCVVSGATKTIAPGAGFTVAAAAAAGPYTVFATLAPDAPSASFTVVVGPSVVVAPSSGAHGLTVAVSGIGFSILDSSTTMSFTALIPGGALWTGTITPGLAVSGPFITASATFTVASSATVGTTYRIRIQGSTGDSGDTSAVFDFLVNPDPTIALAPPTGPARHTCAGDFTRPVQSVGWRSLRDVFNPNSADTGRGDVCMPDRSSNWLFDSWFAVCCPLECSGRKLSGESHREQRRLCANWLRRDGRGNVRPD